jgi:hypothetical protein
VARALGWEAALTSTAAQADAFGAQSPFPALRTFDVADDPTRLSR